MNLDDLLAFHRRTLLYDCIPWWLRHAIDPNGGINSCIADDGTVVSRDKWIWSQWRAVWVFSKLYNQLEQRDEWLEAARHIADFAIAHAWDDSYQGWVMLMTGDGETLKGCESVYSDHFAIYGLNELAKASGETRYQQLACKTADLVLERMATVPMDQVPHFPYPIPPGARTHGVPMILFMILWELGVQTGNQRYCEAAVALQDDIFDNFYRPDRDLLLERISLDGSEYPAPEGTTVVPGHVIEGMWFHIHVARESGNRQRMLQACQLIRRHLEAGWDEEHGGILLAIDADGRDDVAWFYPTMKIWWPHTEALYALLLAHEVCGEPWCLEWYERVHDYSFTHYPVAEHGEWRQRLNRDGTPMEGFVALPVKDPFHLPRALIYSIDVLERLTSH